jgi:hypothetical protein
MSEIEKMYKTIFGEFVPNCSLCAKLIDCEIFKNTHNCNKFECDYKRLFTAEKQLEITKFLLKKAVYYDVKDNKYWFYYEECESAGYKPFDEAIAHFINKLWTDMSEAEKQQVKGILE